MKACNTQTTQQWASFQVLRDDIAVGQCPMQLRGRGAFCAPTLVYFEIGTSEALRCIKPSVKPLTSYDQEPTTAPTTAHILPLSPKQTVGQ